MDNDNKSTTERISEKLRTNAEIADAMLTDKTWIVHVINGKETLGDSLLLGDERRKILKDQIRDALVDWTLAARDVASGKMKESDYNGGNHLLLEKACKGCQSANEIAYAAFTLASTLEKLAGNSLVGNLLATLLKKPTSEQDGFRL